MISLLRSFSTTAEICMDNYITSTLCLLGKYKKSVRFVVLLMAMYFIAQAGNVFEVEERFIESGYLSGGVLRDYQSFMNDLNLPGKVGALFIAGTPELVEKSEKYYGSIETGEIFTSQLRSLQGTKITDVSIASFINGIFGVSAMLFSILVGQFIFKNGYVSLVIFISIVIFRSYSQVLIYGIPDKHSYVVFFPLAVFCVFIALIRFMREPGLICGMVFILCGFVTAYIASFGEVEGVVAVVSIALFAFVMGLKYLMINKKHLTRILLGMLLTPVAMYIGYTAFFQIIESFKNDRDQKFNLAVMENTAFVGHGIYHDLYVSLFRFKAPENKLSGISYDAPYDFYQGYNMKAGNSLRDRRFTREYNTVIKELYLEYISRNYEEIFEYLRASIYDYLLFLPYHSWTGIKSTPEYLPKIDETIGINAQDLAAGHEGSEWTLNIDEDYLAQGLWFKVYFVIAYLLMAQAIFTAFFRFGKHGDLESSSGEITDGVLPIYLLRGMLIYFLFVSVQRILVPLHGQGALVTFNLIVIYNLARIAVRKPIRIPALMMPAWASLLCALLVLFLVVRVLNWEQVKENVNLFSSGEFERSTEGWVAYKADLRIVRDSQFGKVLQVIAKEGNAKSYAYMAVPTRPGMWYEIKVYYKMGIRPHAGKAEIGGRVAVGTEFNVSDVHGLSAITNRHWKLYKASFLAQTPITYITLVNGSPYKGGASYFGAISIVAS